MDTFSPIFILIPLFYCFQQWLCSPFVDVYLYWRVITKCFRFFNDIIKTVSNICSKLWYIGYFKFSISSWYLRSVFYVIFYLFYLQYPAILSINENSIHVVQKYPYWFFYVVMCTFFSVIWLIERLSYLSSFILTISS